MNAIDFNNVTLHSDVEKYIQTHDIAKSDVKVTSLLEPVIAKLAVLYPMWTFVGDGHMNINSSPTLSSFEVQCDGEVLGEIQRRYERNDYQICVKNDRIKASLERGTFYRTKDASKAVAKVKKMFSPKTTQEVAELAREAAGKAAQSAEWSKTREKDDAYDIVKRAANKYVMGTGFGIFMEHVKANYPAQEHELLFTKHEASNKAQEELMTITKVRDVLGHRVNGAVITQRGGTYVVEHKDKVEICDDNTLPEWIRNRIGMLKLIETGQFVSDLGMKVNANTFVIIEPNLTTVTAGDTK